MIYQFDKRKKEIERILKISVKKIDLIRYLFGEKDNKFYGFELLNCFRLYKYVQHNRLNLILKCRLWEKDNSAYVKINFSSNLFVNIAVLLNFIIILFFSHEIYKLILLKEFSGFKIILISIILLAVPLLFLFLKVKFEKENKIFLLEEFENIFKKNNINFNRC